MRVEWLLFAFIFVFLTISDVVYWFWSSGWDGHGGDWTGTTALALAAGLGLLVGFYLRFTAGRLVADRPEDREDADISDGAGEVGFFSPHSWWPLMAAASAAIASLGFIFGWWLILLGGVLTASAVVGMMFQYETSARTGDLAEHH